MAFNIKQNIMQEIKKLSQVAERVNAKATGSHTEDEQV
jgi:hypothetical protein